VRQGTVMVKVYFSVTKEEQARRFERRRTDPLRQWKLSEIDLQAQDKWDEFTNRKYEMLIRTGTRAAPWLIIRSDEKQLARLNTMKVILGAVDYKDRSPDLDFTPDPQIVVPGTEEIAMMQAEFRRNGRFTG
jgi:polyphosphate kinase